MSTIDHPMTISHLSTSTTATEFIVTGIIVGIFHVLARPDHLSALATLTAMNISDDHMRGYSCMLGITWGFGHSISTIIVGSIMITLKIDINDWWNMVLEGVVGIVLLALGCYGLYVAIQNKRDSTSDVISNISKCSSDESIKLKKDEEDTYTTTSDISSLKIEIVKLPTQQLEKSRRTSPSTSLLDDSGRDTVVRMMEGVLKDDESEAQSRHSDALSEALSKVLEQSEESSNEVNSSDSDDDNNRIRYTEDDNISSSSDEALLDWPALDLSGRSTLGGDYSDRSGLDISGRSGRSSGGGRSQRSNSFIKYQKKTPKVASASSLLKKHATVETSILSPKKFKPTMNIPRPSESCSLSTASLLALFVGALQGIAGISEVLGVPTVEFDARTATAYLGMVCLTSTLVMAVFSTCYGTFCKWYAGEKQARVFFVESTSASFSLVVGIVWLVLLGIGKI